MGEESDEDLSPDSLKAKDKLKGKSRREKQRILHELENQKQIIIQEKYKSERQQLRHDARMAQQKIGERERTNQMMQELSMSSMVELNDPVGGKKKGENSTDARTKEGLMVRLQRNANDNTQLADDNPEMDPNDIVNAMQNNQM